MSSQPLRIFIGSEPRMWAAETVLRYSIETHASIPTEIVSMDYTLGGVWGGWNIGRPRAMPGRHRKDDEGNSIWFTDFTNYRWAIPEACGFTGRAVYMDVDMLVLGDVAELLTMPMDKPILTLHPGETSVMVMDCAAVGRLGNWPRIEKMKNLGWDLRRYIQVLSEQEAFGQLPPEWNCLDGRGFLLTRTRLVHYTDMGSQPWRPYPERIHYRPHKVPEMDSLWFHYATRARKAGYFQEQEFSPPAYPKGKPRPAPAPAVQPD
ncbi:MAG: hypothetical protein LJE84_00365 [Gammaproteobacteria bacterium]|nr:hypothetical protein [Gammaproteobacteria bacterium]